MTCRCDPLQILPLEQAEKDSVDAFLHQATCSEYDDTKPHADEMRKRLNKVELHMQADLVLSFLPKKQMVKEPVVVGTSQDEGMPPGFIVEWIYPGVTLRMERAVMHHEIHGKISLYAVQRIIPNGHSKKFTKRGRKARRQRNKRARHSHSRPK